MFPSVSSYSPLNDASLSATQGNDCTCVVSHVVSQTVPNMASKVRKDSIQPHLGQEVAGRRKEYWFSFHKY